MMITSVEMINWRAYDQRLIRFQPGLTFLLGPNGAGKTSILEAITYGLTGEPSTVADRGRLLRDPDRPASAIVSFDVAGQDYRVERSQSLGRALDANLVRLDDEQRLETTHKRVTTQIEHLMGVSAEFLRRIVYMAEGDVFNFLREPPGQAVDHQIRQVLGLTQLDEFMAAVLGAEKRLKVELKRTQDVFTQLQKLGIQSDADFEGHLRRLNAHHTTFDADLFSVQAKINELQRENEGIAHLSPVLARVQAVFQHDTDSWSPERGKPIPALSTQIDLQLREIGAQIEELRIASARSEGEQLAQKRTLDILASHAQADDTLQCPVCHKLMSGDERQSIARDVESAITRLAEERLRCETQIAESCRLHDALSERSGALQELQRALDQAALSSVTPETSLSELQEIVESQETFFLDSVSNLEHSATAAKSERADLESERARYLSVLRDLQGLGYGSIEEAGDALFGLESRSLSLRAVSRAAQETLTQQRDTSIGPIYDQLSHVWQAFMGEDQWRIDLDNESRPRFEDRRGRQIDLDQFSGGEKTALLVALHVLMAQYFSNSDFLLIDEPLEHLDPVNRRALVRFLVGAFRRNSFRQAIVATVEESLVRRYMSDDGIHVIELQGRRR